MVAADIEVSRKLITQSKGGVVTRFGDTESLAQAVEEIVANPQLCQNMGNNGRSTAACYDGTVLWPRHAELLEMVGGSPRMK